MRSRFAVKEALPRQREQSSKFGKFLEPSVLGYWGGIIARVVIIIVVMTVSPFLGTGSSSATSSWRACAGPRTEHTRRARCWVTQAQLSASKGPQERLRLIAWGPDIFKDPIRTVAQTGPPMKPDRIWVNLSGAAMRRLWASPKGQPCSELGFLA